VTPGLAGTPKTSTFNYISGSNYQTAADTAICATPACSGNYITTEGQRLWFEFRIKWSPGWIWQYGVGSEGSNYKWFELTQTTCPGGTTGGRILFGVDTNFAAGSEGRPDLNLYPNLECPNNNPNVGNGGGLQFFANNRFVPGTEYHIIVEIKYSQIAQGWVKLYVDGVIQMQAVNVRTAGNGTLEFVRLGGIAPEPNTGTAPRYLRFDEVRMTTTDLTPGGGLNTPGNPLICRGAACTPAMLMPLGGLLGWLLWLRPALRRRAGRPGPSGSGRSR
jgi:hypothetical protein